MTLHLDDARWRAAVDAEHRGEASPTQRKLLEQYKPRGAEYRAEQAFLEALSAPPAYEDTRPEWLDEVLDSMATEVEDRSPPRTRWLPWVSVAAAVLLTTVAAVVGMRWVGEEPSRAEPIAFSVPSLPDASALESPPGGSPQVDPTSAGTQPGASIAPSSLCASGPQHSICAKPDARVTAVDSGAVALHQGVVTIRSQDTEEAHVQLDDVTVRAGRHSVVVVERTTAGWSVSIESGTATVVEIGSARRLDRGESLERGRGKAPAAAPKPGPRPVKASTLLARARAQRRDGNTASAMKTYADLIRQHPRSPAAQTARMSLAQLHLDRGKTKDALRLFRAYEKRGGPLAEEAAYGEFRALKKLGRGAEAQRVAEAFARRFPDSHYSAKLDR
ncbi:MAG: tetratricopeptide repeat protein [Nannocystales bacterium]